jgi:glycerol kinase
LQFQADILGIPVVRPKVTETTALGAAYLAGLAVGYWPSEQDVVANWEVDHRFEPSMPRDRAEQLRRRWTEALQRAKNWEDHTAVNGAPKAAETPT